jgi:hypothetical protein
MQIKPVADLLAAAGLHEPQLFALVPNEANYTVLLMQPNGQIEASAASVRNRDRPLARQQFGKFLADARQTQPDLAITPEYSMPWETLVAAIKTGAGPAEGKIWVLGCESIKYSDLDALKVELAPLATVRYEPLPPDATRFTDPLAYVFLAPPIQGNAAARLVILVQFKTHPMGDDGHFEINAMQPGTAVYQFGGGALGLRLVSLICADAFALTDAHAAAIYDRTLIVHIQLNQKPRHEQFRRYREKLLNLSGDATEVICLNWARNVSAWHGEHATPWNNIGGSAWYMKPNRSFDDKDATLCANHRRGLYYTWLKPFYAHALFFNYEPATYHLVAAKVAHIGISAAMSRRRGPQLVKTCIWNVTTTAWEDQASVQDGFSSVVGESGDAKDEIKRIADDNPIEAERVLALSAGKVGHSDDWHKVHLLDSCVIDESEIIQRITFCQDTSERACEFRIARLKRCGSLWNILKTGVELPPALEDFKKGFKLGWTPDFPHQNAISSEGKRATVIYMGEESAIAQVEATAMRVAEYLHRKFANSNKSLEAIQRVAVWFRKDNKITRFVSPQYVKVDKSDNASAFDIARQE